jgi:hypothetical protein
MSGGPKGSRREEANRSRRPQEKWDFRPDNRQPDILSFWKLLIARARGSNQHEAEEIALPNILLESESEEMARVLEELEKMEET